MSSILLRTNSAEGADKARVPREMARQMLNETNEDLDLAIHRLLAHSTAAEPFSELVSTRAKMIAQPASPAILVGVRVRPPLEREMDGGSALVGVSAHQGSRVFVTKSDRPVVVAADGAMDSRDVSAFSFDRVFDLNSSQAELYEMVRPLTTSVMNGINATVFAYGQTGSGKTYTMGEHWIAEVRGVVPRAVEQLLEGCTHEDVVTLQCLQLYGERLTDLLVPNTAEVRLRESPDGDVFAQGATCARVESFEHAMQLLQGAASRRSTSATAMNLLSSRSHLITTLTVERSDTVARLNLVDLAGSERVKRSGASGAQLSEACAINSSLQHLADVVSCLIERDASAKHSGRHVPYRNCALTRILCNSLGGNCRTLLLATISASFDSASESISTLRFARSFSSVKNEPIVNTGKKQSRIDNKPTKKPAAAARKKRVMGWHNLDMSEHGGLRVVSTSIGDLAVRVYGDPASQPVVVYLHGYPSSSEDGTWVYPALVHSGFCVVAPDMPGCGLSVGASMVQGGVHRSARSEFNLDKGGAADIVTAVLKALDIKRATFFGSDWGAGISLSIALRNPRLAERVVVLHASYQEKKKGELRGLVPKTLVLWVKEDQFHPWNKWRLLAKSIPHASVTLLKRVMFKGGQSSSAGLRPEMIGSLLAFLTGRNPYDEQQQIEGALPEAMGYDISGNHVSLQPLIAVDDGQLGVELSRQIFQGNSEQTALDLLRSVHHNGRLDELLRAVVAAGSPLYSEALKLFGSLPKLEGLPFAHPGQLVACGLWSDAPTGWDMMASSKRYFSGRQVLVRAYVIHEPNHSDYMKISNNPGAERFVTHHAQFVEMDGALATVRVAKQDGGWSHLQIPMRELVELNEGQCFPSVPGRGLRFEDGVWCNYSSTAVQAKLYQIALTIAPLVATLDFEDKHNCLPVQQACVRAIRGCLDMVSFKKWRGVIPSRTGRTDNVAKLAIHGQGQCHGVSSTMAAFLYPFTQVLGIELKYRGGFTFYDAEPGVSVSNVVERHQWLELTYRPSMELSLIHISEPTRPY
eukprot:TRINITY_DN44354_c0_g1_i2.p1 TRINITY_DN44354_c0_g1~~TRINITY_DN44354_c0_g1_i2.p1  ORF type:complete len:1035 (-),score=223.64 TRINITY_DN44354_c0_g1_i2:89-3193(-)